MNNAIAVSRYQDDTVDLAINWCAVIVLEKRPLYINVYFNTAGQTLTIKAPTQEINNSRYEMLYVHWEQSVKQYVK
jgi:hypothetical protein